MWSGSFLCSCEELGRKLPPAAVCLHGLQALSTVLILAYGLSLSLFFRYSGPLEYKNYIYSVSWYR